MFVTVTDIRPRAPFYTEPVPALRYLMSQGVDLVYTNPLLVTIIDTLARLRLFIMFLNIFSLLPYKAQSLRVRLSKNEFVQTNDIYPGPHTHFGTQKHMKSGIFS